MRSVEPEVVVAGEEGVAGLAAVAAVEVRLQIVWARWTTFNSPFTRARMVHSITTMMAASMSMATSIGQGQMAN